MSCFTRISLILTGHLLAERRVERSRRCGELLGLLLVYATYQNLDVSCMTNSPLCLRAKWTVLQTMDADSVSLEDILRGQLEEAAVGGIVLERSRTGNLTSRLSNVGGAWCAINWRIQDIESVSAEFQVLRFKRLEMFEH